MVSTLLTVTIDFDKSHYFFPKIIIGILILLLILIAIIHLPKKIKAVRSGESDWRFFAKDLHKLKLFGTIALIAIYFKAMEWVGSLFPNMGYGFLITSVVFMFIISLLFVEKITKRTMLILTLNSVITPVAAWFIFGRIFFITLP